MNSGLVNHGVPASPAIATGFTGRATPPATTSATDRLPPEADVAHPARWRRDDEHDRVVHDLHDRDREGVRARCNRYHRGDREAGAQQRQARERIAEDEGKRYGQRNGAPIREAERRTA